MSLEIGCLKDLEQAVILILSNLTVLKKIAQGFDKVLVFGGDGTMLDAVRHAIPYDIPVLGVNLGYLGFLAEFDADVRATDLAKALKSSDYAEKTLIEVTFDKSYLALNDLVIKSNTTRPVVIDMFVDDMFADTFKSDGIIVSTPTGSTAYSLSAGGPVLAPDVKAVVVNPICPHSLHSRPLVVSDKARLTIQISGEEGEVSVAVDGELVSFARVGDRILVETSKSTAKFVDCGNNNFYNKLLKKMNVWSTTLQKSE